MAASSISENRKRIAKNTLVLYFRMLVLMVIGLFTSRVVLRALGVEDYGIYGAVAGVVTLCTVFTGTMSSAISRFITFELGRGGKELHKVFSTAVSIQLLLSALIIILGESLGLWWLNHKMVIPAERLLAGDNIVVLANDYPCDSYKGLFGFDCFRFETAFNPGFVLSVH